MPTLLEQLSAPFADEEHRTFRGRGDKEFTYIEDETVMDRLDHVIGVGNWQIVTEPQPVYEGVVKVRLGVLFPDASEWVWYEDFGYPNNKDGDALKEAVSDGIRRVGRYIGIARYLYRKDTHKAPVGRQNGHTAPTPPQPVQTPPRSSTAVPDDFSELDFDSLSPVRPGNVATMVRPILTGTQAVTDRVGLSEGEDWCPVHSLAWKLMPAGTSKAGAPYDPFWACSSKDKPYCKEKPTPMWVKARVPVNA